MREKKRQLGWRVPDWVTAAFAAAVSESDTERGVADTGESLAAAMFLFATMTVQQRQQTLAYYHAKGRFHLAESQVAPPVITETATGPAETASEQERARRIAQASRQADAQARKGKRRTANEAG